MSALVLGFLAAMALYVGCYAMLGADEYAGGRYAAVILLGWAIYMVGVHAALTVVRYYLYGDEA